jgi:hypothetical protein
VATILYDDRVTAVPNATAAGGHLWLSPADLAAATGWKLETEGLCKGDACVRVDSRWQDAAGRVDLSAFAEHLGQPIVSESARDAYAFGTPLATRKNSMYSLEAPDFTLPDLNGKLYTLSQFRGKKVFLWSWGSY